MCSNCFSFHNALGSPLRLPVSLHWRHDGSSSNNASEKDEEGYKLTIVAVPAWTVWKSLHATTMVKGQG